MLSFRFFIRAGLAIAAVAALAGLSAAVGAPPAGRETTVGVAQDAGNCVGEETCLTCHEEQAYKGTAHARTFNPNSPAAGKGCEACHGPGQAHVDGSGDKTKIVNLGSVWPAKANETCVSCHNRATHALWEGIQHDQR